MVAPRKFTDEQRAQICDAYLAGERLASIAARHGTSIPTISTIAMRSGIQRRNITKRSKIVNLRKKDRSIPVDRIAEIVGSRPGYVRQVLSECGFVHDSIEALGRAARDAGLTVQEIRHLSNSGVAA